MRRGLTAFCLGLLAILLGMGGTYLAILRPAAQTMGGETIRQVIGPATLILDAGHGGEDGGAVSITGVSESQINLAVALRMEELLSFYGIPVTMLRRDDISLHDSGCTTLREKKVSDLKNRVAAVEAEEEAVLISIHQNSFPQSQYYGAQVFYAPTEGSQALAEHIQGVVHRDLQPDNSRASKEIPDSVYLMNHISCPGVLVECGFLTNPEEEWLLRNEGYQTKMAAVLAAAWLSAPAQ